MSPVLFRYGPMVFYAYGVFYALGIIVGGLLMERAARRAGVNPEIMVKTVLIGTICVVIGARAFFVCQFWDRFARNLPAILRVWDGGLVLYGGLIAAVATLPIWFRLNGVKVTLAADLCAPPVALGVAIGRIGCFLRGCCYGKETSAPWGMSFPKFIGAHGKVVGSPAFLSQVDAGVKKLGDIASSRIHPTQIYSVMLGVLLFAGLTFLSRRRTPAGSVFCFYLVGYGVGRLVIEFFRGDNEAVLLNLTISQIVSIILIACGIIGLRLLGFVRIGRPSAR